MTHEYDPLARTVPTAYVTTRSGWSWAWIFPIAALAISLWVGWQAQAERGPLIEIRVSEGFGIGAGDAVRYRGIDVGQIETAELDKSLSEVVLEVRLSVRAAALAQANTRFWVVRPHMTLDGVTGLETIFGARYLAALPGEPGSQTQTEFVALEEPPILLEKEAGSLEIDLIASRRFGIQPGAPITYRQVDIGRVLEVELASDASGIEIHAYIHPEYTRLVRENSRFWEESGLDLEVGLIGGVELGLDSLRALIVGAIAIATPDEPGLAARDGHRFTLEAEAKPAWLEWRPSLPVGDELLPESTPTPKPVRAKSTWTHEQFFIDLDRQQIAWVLSVDGCLIGPTSLLAPPELKEDESIALSVLGKPVDIGAMRWSNEHLSMVETSHPIGIPWPTDWIRATSGLEDVLVVGEPLDTPLALSRDRFHVANGVWVLESEMDFESKWHGGFAFSRSDGRLVGVLLLENGEAIIAPVPNF